tara:strand:+ start:1768 stop:2598 length:831 start_codon:yes stop_codon:yes gene_type:complete
MNFSLQYTIPNNKEKFCSTKKTKNINHNICEIDDFLCIYLAYKFDLILFTYENIKIKNFLNFNFNIHYNIPISIYNYNKKKIDYHIDINKFNKEFINIYKFIKLKKNTKFKNNRLPHKFSFTNLINKRTLKKYKSNNKNSVPNLVFSKSHNNKIDLFIKNNYKNNFFKLNFKKYKFIFDGLSLSKGYIDYKILDNIITKLNINMARTKKDNIKSQQDTKDTSLKTKNKIANKHNILLILRGNRTNVFNKKIENIFNKLIKKFINITIIYIHTNIYI